MINYRYLLKSVWWGVCFLLHINKSNVYNSFLKIIWDFYIDIIILVKMKNTYFVLKLEADKTLGKFVFENVWGGQP